MIQTVKKPKAGKSGKSAAPPSVAPSVADIDLKDIKKSTEEQKKKPAESKKATKKVILSNSDNSTLFQILLSLHEKAATLF